MYSPGSLKLAVVLAVPLNTDGAGALNVAVTTGGRPFAKVTVPGPRNFVQVTVTGGPIARAASTDFASSATHKGRLIGFETVVVTSRLCPRGPWTKGPLSEKAMNCRGLPLASAKSGS